jgi:NAD(P)-dependent dehydrogenase (short-subunit alcohol dehydrogenase family)
MKGYGMTMGAWLEGRVAVVTGGAQRIGLACVRTLCAMRAEAAVVPIRRLGLPGEAARHVGFLRSDASSCITGAAIDINGGGLVVWREAPGARLGVATAACLATGRRRGDAARR